MYVFACVYMCNMYTVYIKHICVPLCYVYIYAQSQDFFLKDNILRRNCAYIYQKMHARILNDGILHYNPKVN